MKKFYIGKIPSVLYGEKSDKVFLFVHGKCGYKEEAKDFAKFAVPKGWQVLGIDLPSHGERQCEENNFDVWHAVPEIQEVMEYIKSKWQRYALRANSIGAYFSMLACGDVRFEKCLFVSPILDMEKLIQNMMLWAGVSEERLKAEKEIATDFGEVLSFDYLKYAGQNKIKSWKSKTAILYAENDNLTEIDTVKDFVKRFNCTLEIMQNGEHWFHTKEQIDFLNKWTQENLQSF